jgi:DNA-binding GntR family transcriptional regulator
MTESTAAGGLFQTRKFSDIAGGVIRDRIMSGDLPGGSRLNEVALAEELRISRPPIREALRVLSGEGLVEFVPGRGAFVVNPDREAIVQLGEIRLALEKTAARCAAERADATDRVALQQVMEHTEAQLTDPSSPYPHHIEFHAALSGASHNPRLGQVLNEVIRQMRLASIQSNEDPRRAHEVLQEHHTITAAVLRGDPDAAEAAMADHITATTQAIVVLLDRKKGEQGT